MKKPSGPPDFWKYYVFFLSIMASGMGTRFKNPLRRGTTWVVVGTSGRHQRLSAACLDSRDGGAWVGEVRRADRGPESSNPQKSL